MQALRFGLVSGILAIIFLTSGCNLPPGHLHTLPGGGNGGSGGTNVIFTFVGGTPTAAATQVSGGAFGAATITSGQLTINVPSPTAQYAVAYMCPPAAGSGGNTVTSEFVIEATPKDGSSFTVSCLSPPPGGSATGSADATAIPGATDIQIFGIGGFGSNVGSISGSFNVNLPTGVNDIAAVAVDASQNVLAVKFVRAQSVPGVINAGNAIVFTTADQVSMQSLVVNNVPSGDVTPPAVQVEYFTANGTVVLLSNNSGTSYPAVPGAAAQSGDFYLFQASTNDIATHRSAIGIFQSTTSPGSLVTLALPTPWTFSGPAAADFPTFTFTYTGFNGQPEITQQGEIEWAPTASTVNVITVTATASFQGTSNTITIPNLSTVTGFMAPAPSGTTIDWVADIFGGTILSFDADNPSSGILSFVENQGTYVQP